MQDDLAAAYRGNTDGTLKGALDADIAAMIMTTGLYLSAVDASLIDGPANRADVGSIDQLHLTAVDNALKVWTLDPDYARPALVSANRQADQKAGAAAWC